MKCMTVQRKVLKIESKGIRNYSILKHRELNKIEKVNGVALTPFKEFKWVYDIDVNDVKNNDKIISLGESHTLRMIDDILGKNKNIREEYYEYRKNIRLLKQGKPIDEKYEGKNILFFHKKIDKLQFEDNYIAIVFNRKLDFNYINKGLIVNGKSYKRLYGTSGSIKKNTVMYVCDDKLSKLGGKSVHEVLLERLENGKRDIDLVPSKYEAYLSLNSSASTPVATYIKPKPDKDIHDITELSWKNILVVPDHIVNFKTKATVIHKCKDESPNIEYVDNYEINLEQSDGCGIITPDLAKAFSKKLGVLDIATGFIVRSSFVKGTLFTFDLKAFKDEIAKKDVIQDIWNKDYNVDDIKIVLPVSMFKLWEAYKDMEDYIDNCIKHKHTISVTKVIPDKLESERTMNYQFLAPLNLKKDDVIKMITPTIQEFHDILGGDFRKTILFLRGADSNIIEPELRDGDFVQALMVDDSIINDMYIRRKVMGMMKGFIERAKIGQIKVKGNYSIISGCIYGFAQHIFKMEDTSGLLGEGEFYSHYWNERGVNRVAAMRAPMCTHSNYRVLDLKDNEELRKWYKYIKACVVFNCHDSTTESLSGADKDGDSVFTTDNEFIIKGIKNLPPIICPAEKKPEKKKITETQLRQSNLYGFNNDVGWATNIATSIRNKMASFDENSIEYKELEQREMAIQRIQQSIIDSIKLGFSEDIPKSWYVKDVNEITEEDSEEVKARKRFNLKIMADKKPYFFKYIYPQINQSYIEYEENWNNNSMRFCRQSIGSLTKKENKTEDEQRLLDLYYQNYPVDISDSLVNQICWEFENEFDGYFRRKENKTEFDYTVYKSEAEYDSKLYNKIKSIYLKYKDDVKTFAIRRNDVGEGDKKDAKMSREEFLDKYKRLILEECPDENILCNIVLDMCYKGNENPQFAWDMCGQTIIKNLLIKNDNTVSYFEKESNGEILFGGERFNIKTRKVEC